MKSIKLLIAAILFSQLLGSQGWVEVGGGMNGIIDKLVVYEGKLVASGWFTQAGGNNAYNIAFWDGTNWSGPDTSNIGLIEDIVVFNDTLFGIATGGIYYWQDTIWGAYISFPELIMGCKMIEYNNELYVYRHTLFTISKVQGDSLIYIANFGMEGGGITDWCIYQGYLYIAGCYTTFTGVNSPHISYFDGTTWYAMGSGLSGGSSASAITGFNNNVYIGGGIWAFEGNPGSHILEWDGSSLNPFPEEPNGGVSFLETINGKMYMGGNFIDSIGNLPVTSVVAWDGINWTNIGDFNFPMYMQMLEYNGKLYAGGYFTTIDGDSINYVAYYDETGSIDNEKPEIKLNIYPNPTNDYVVINNEELRMQNVSVFDIYGREVGSPKTEVRSGECEVDLSNEPKGIYIIKVNTSRGEVVEKIVLE